MKHINKFNEYNKVNENSYRGPNFEGAKTIEDIEEIAKTNKVTKGNLIKLAYNEDTSNIDSALPKRLWSKLEELGGTFWFVMDYKDNIFGKLVHLGEKILGGELTNWEEKIYD